MKKKNLIAYITAAVLCSLYLTGCNPTASASSTATGSESVPTSSESAVSTPVSAPVASSAPAAPSIPAQDFELLQQLVLADVNKALQDYADGTLPAAYAYASEGSNSSKVPQGVTLPTQATWEELAVEYPAQAEYSDYLMLTVYSTMATLPLPDDYEMVFSSAYPTASEKAKWQEVGVSPNILIVDGRKSKTADRVELDNGAVFTNINSDRIRKAAEFTNLPLPGFTEPAPGSILWLANDGQLTLRVVDMRATETGFVENQYDYSVDASGTVTLEFYYEPNLFTEAEATAFGQAALDQFKEALAEIDT